MFADRGVGNNDGEREGANRRQQGFAVFASYNVTRRVSRQSAEGAYDSGGIGREDNRIRV